MGPASPKLLMQRQHSKSPEIGEKAEEESTKNDISVKEKETTPNSKDTVLGKLDPLAGSVSEDLNNALSQSGLNLSGVKVATENAESSIH